MIIGYIALPSKSERKWEGNIYDSLLAQVPENRGEM